MYLIGVVGFFNVYICIDIFYLIVYVFYWIFCIDVGILLLRYGGYVELGIWNVCVIVVEKLK